MAKLTLPVLGAALMLSACATAVPAYPTPPPLPAESIPLPPVSEQRLIWRPGDWVYVGGSYRYEPGQYQPLQPGQSTSWMRGHWAGDNGNYQWVPGHWS